MHRGATIGGLARATGVNLETIRYYERIGLMPAPARSASGHRIYEPAHETRLTFIRRARELGFPIEDVRGLLALSATDQPCCEVRAIASQHLDAVRAKLADLQRLEAVLAATVERCAETLGTPHCAVLEMLEEGA
ncbi:helix-turn-helix domain-containing protein [Phenylobacterium sp. J367]|uniref:MerR family transcriptional regulator n=1 Tax=Phenylobacterium sp. J367 TaxID=2898435 RepID=UPI002150AA6E|nr:helix-turn-helix domain-containing protein [Phenylobacterium sp. J367]MCR5878575.1 helix-turn-helix domain-containing protein [Phenylobacterium sp. J367]